MAKNQIAFPVNDAIIGTNRIVAGTTTNTNLDGSGTLTYINDIKTGTPLTSADKVQIRRLSAALTGSLATATAIRFFISTVTTGNSSSNTWYLTGKDLVLPVITVASTSEIPPVEKTFDLGTFILGANQYLCYAVTTAVANGAVVTAEADNFTA
jgi:hypothetical protein